MIKRCWFCGIDLVPMKDDIFGLHGMIEDCNARCCKDCFEKYVDFYTKYVNDNKSEHFFMDGAKMISLRYLPDYARFAEHVRKSPEYDACKLHYCLKSDEEANIMICAIITKIMESFRFLFSKEEIDLAFANTISEKYDFFKAIDKSYPVAAKEFKYRMYRTIYSALRFAESSYIDTEEKDVYDIFLNDSAKAVFNEYILGYKWITLDEWKEAVKSLANEKCA